MNALTFTEKNGTYNDGLTVVTFVTDNDGKTRVNDKATRRSHADAGHARAARRRGFRITSAVNLPPGRYQLRVSAADSAGVAGSVVPYARGPRLLQGRRSSMSGVTLLSASGMLAPTARVKDDPVGSAADASADDRPRVHARRSAGGVCGNLRERAERAAAHDRHHERGAGGRRNVVFRNTETRSSTELQGGGAAAKAGGYGYTAQIPLKDVAPGLYVVHVEGKRRDGNVPAVARDVQIRVR